VSPLKRRRSLTAAHRDQPQIAIAATRQQRFRVAGMCSMRAMNDDDRQMLGRILDEG
jgi:hypothetical protein